MLTKSIMKKLNLLVAIVLALALVASACGDDDDDSSSDDAQVQTGDDAPQTSGADDTSGSGGDGDGSGDGGTSGGDDPEPTPPSTTSTEPPAAAAGDECTEELKGGSITMGMFSETAGLDPTVTSGSGVTGMIELMSIYDILIRLDKETGEYVPHLAESLVSNDDFTVWTLGLREGVKFGNGDPLDADAVMASMDRWWNLDPAAGQRNQSIAFVSFITDMTKIDDLTIQFTLDSPWAGFPYTLADEPGMIVNVNVVNERGLADFNRNPEGAGAGPYEFVRYAPQEEIVVRAKDDYWGGPVCIEEITYIRVPGAPATYEAFQNDELQVAFLREPRVIAEAIENGDTNALQFLKNTGGVVMINNGVRGSTPPTTDVRLRRAIMLALEPSVMDERANEGTGRPTNALLDSDSFYYDDDLFPQVETNAAEARRLVEEVKAEGNWDGSIRLQCHNAPSRIDWALAAQALLEAAGFDVELLNDGNIQDMIAVVLINADYDLSCWGFNMDDETPYIPLLQHTCASRSNRTGYCNEEMDAAIAQLRLASNYDETQAALAEVWRVWRETIPSVAYETTVEYVVFKDNIKGVVGTQASGIMFHDAFMEQ